METLLQEPYACLGYLIADAVTASSSSVVVEQKCPAVTYLPGVSRTFPAAMVLAMGSFQYLLLQLLFLGGDTVGKGFCQTDDLQ